jgi:thiol:disulfide interchange protein DsbD
MKFPHPGRMLFALLMLCFALPAMAQDDDLLPVTQAFHLTTDASTPGVVKLHWQIAPNYYLYRGRIKIKAQDDSKVKLGEVSLPDGKKKHDEYLGDVEIYHGAVDATLPYTLTDAGAKTVDIAVQYQGCHEVDPKICYPPNTEKLSLVIGGASTIPAADADAGATAMAPGGAMTGAMTGAAKSSGGLGAALGDLSGAKPTAVDGPALPPEQAFRFEAIATAPDMLLLRWTMPKNYYLYRDKTELKLIGADGIALGEPDWPSGVAHHDEHFGDTIVYFDQVELPVPLKGTTKAREITVQASFQGCQEGGICYPVMTRTALLDLSGGKAVVGETALVKAAPAAAAAAVANTADEQSEEQRLAGALGGKGRWLALLGFFGAGLLLAFTPCVLPMVPILSGLIAGAGEHVSTRRAFVLSVVYVLASSVVFIIAGVIAGLAGANLQAAFQQPWILWCFAALFVVLSFSMFGFYELQLPSALQNRLVGISNQQKSGSLVGVAIMGVLSALIVGPCVAPPLAAAVLYIGQQHDPVFGGLALFLLSMGMGVPLVIFGTAAGKLLPRAGGWMDAVKAVFGVLFLALAIWMLSRILDTLWVMLMVGVLLMTSAVYMGALERMPDGASGWRKLWKALGVIVLLFGALQLIGVGAGSRDLLRPLSGLGGGTAAVAQAGPSFRTIKSVADLDKAVAEASAAGKPVLFDFYADWCVSCKEMEKLTFPTPAVQQALDGYVLLKADVTANDDTDQALLKHFSLYGPPATIFFGKDGTERRGLRLIGFENAEGFAARAQKARN